MIVINGLLDRVKLIDLFVDCQLVGLESLLAPGLNSTPGYMTDLESHSTRNLGGRSFRGTFPYGGRVISLAGSVGSVAQIHVRQHRRTRAHVTQ